MKPPMKPPAMEVEARHEAADAAAWPRWRWRSKPWNLGFQGGAPGLRVWGWGSPAPEKKRLPKEGKIAGGGGGSRRFQS
jgi:hypothetical protein